MLRAKLVVVGGDAKAGEFNLTLPTIIGRGKEADLTIPHALVSREHSKIFERDGRLVVEDLKSLNGTFVNNTRIEGEQALEPNQLLTLGNVTFRAVYEIDGSNANAGVTLSDRDLAATVISQKQTEAETDVVVEADTDAGSVMSDQNATGSALSEIDSFEPDDSDSFGRLSEINSSVFAVQTRGPEKPPIGEVAPECPVAKAESEQKLAKVVDEQKSNVDQGVDLGIETGQEIAASVSSIDGLPLDDGPQVSFVGKIGDAIDSDEVVDSVKIDLGEEKKNAIVDESRLGSFVKRLPK